MHAHFLALQKANTDYLPTYLPVVRIRAWLETISSKNLAEKNILKSSIFLRPMFITHAELAAHISLRFPHHINSCTYTYVVQTRDLCFD